MTEPTKLEKTRREYHAALRAVPNVRGARAVDFEELGKRVNELEEAMIEAAREEAKHPPCEWVGDDDAPNASAWTTFCNKEVYLGSSPAVCGLIYCPYCGGKIEEASDD